MNDLDALIEALGRARSTFERVAALESALEQQPDDRALRLDLTSLQRLARQQLDQANCAAEAVKLIRSKLG